MRALVVTAALVVAVCAAACPGGAAGTDCEVSADCPTDALCVDGVCVGGAGEGEGEGGEGEGEGGEGEGEGGEGEGEGGEGEGELVVGEGEGEGELEGGEGEGEGEGEGDPCGGCGDFQVCNAGTATCEFTGEVCDAFLDGAELSGFAEGVGSLDAAVDLTHVLGDRPRLMDNITLFGVGAGVTMRVTLLSDAFDPVLFRFAEFPQCRQDQFNDDIAPPDVVDSEIEFVSDGTEPQLIVSSFGGTGTGEYVLRTRPLLCGLETEDAFTFNACAPRVAAQSCNNNPCVPDGAGNTTGEFCCVNASCRSAFGLGQTIGIVFDPNPAGACAPE